MKVLAVTLSLSALCILATFAAPANQTLEEIGEIKQNLSALWKLLIDLKSQLSVLELEEVANVAAACPDDTTEDVVKVDEADKKSVEDEEEDEEEEEEDEEKKKNKTEENDEKPKKISVKGNKGCQSDNNNSRYLHQLQPLPAPVNENNNEAQIHNNTNVTAYCSLRPNKALPPTKRMNLRGKIYLTEQKANKLFVSIKLSGLQPTKGSTTVSQSLKHGFHVHEIGNLNNGCESTGAHFNPFNKTHGPPHSEHRHLGDLGNIETDSHGNIDKIIEYHIDKALSGPDSFIGRAIVIHEKVDDLGSNPSDIGSTTTGNAGTRLACCIIYKLN